METTGTERANSEIIFEIYDSNEEKNVSRLNNTHNKAGYWLLLDLILDAVYQCNKIINYFSSALLAFMSSEIHTFKLRRRRSSHRPREAAYHLLHTLSEINLTSEQEDRRRSGASKAQTGWNRIRIHIRSHERAIFSSRSESGIFRHRIATRPRV